MLPEGSALERMAALAGVRPVDTYGILAAFGHDCAGAIMVLPDGDRAGDGTWQLPCEDAPSTWILKPDGPHAMAANEATCLRLAAACGLPVPEAELLDVAGLPVLAVKRYDRQDASAGDIPVRVHQEDGCQATATPPGL